MEESEKDMNHGQSIYSKVIEVIADRLYRWIHIGVQHANAQSTKPCTVLATETEAVVCRVETVLA
jgi:hypothetical protein